MFGEITKVDQSVFKDKKQLEKKTFKRSCDLKNSVTMMIKKRQEGKEWQGVYVNVGTDIAAIEAGFKRTDLIAMTRNPMCPDIGYLERVTYAEKAELEKKLKPGERLRIRKLGFHSRKNHSYMRITYDHGPDLPSKEQWPHTSKLEILDVVPGVIMFVYPQPSWSIGEYKIKAAAIRKKYERGQI